MLESAKWIAPPTEADFSAITFCRTVNIKKPLRKAQISVTSLGNYLFCLNGKKVGNGVLTPGWTSYQHRVQYQTYDVTALLEESNRIEIGVAPGWAMSELAWKNNHHVYSKNPALLAELRLIYADGSEECVVSDEAWEVMTSYVTFSQIYHGETVDKTAEIKCLGNATPSPCTAKPVPQEGEWIVENERIAPVEILRTPNGETVIDFGQNLTGYVEVRLLGKRGDRIVLHHAEVLDKDGNFYVGNMRTAKNEVAYVLGGNGEEVFKPSFTFQGFRYVRLVEYPLDTDCFQAIAVHSEIKRTGRFTCGNEKINQLYHNIIWGQKSNYLDVPTDCPQRDERLGWTGDAQVFCRTAAINFDVEKFFSKWLRDVALEQHKNGAIPDFVPFVNRSMERSSAAWGDVACVAPYQLYLAYGNKKELKRYFPMMKKWVDYMRGAGPEEFLWLGGWHFGDWLAMDGDPDVYIGMTPKDLIASAYYAYSTSLLVSCGKALGKDMSEYEALYQSVRAAFRARYLKNGKLHFVPDIREDAPPLTVRETQTAYALILYFGLADEEEKASLAKRLVSMIKKNGMRMTTGFVGTPYLLHALSQNGYVDIAYKLLLQEKTPSWLYSVNHGATTMWEHWNSQKEDGSFWSTDMNSFNHYAYGAVYDWIFGVAIGIQPVLSAPAYKEITLEPHPCRALGFAKASIESRNGFILSHWYYKEDRVYYEFEIPKGVTAHLRLPSGRCETLTGGIYHFAE